MKKLFFLCAATALLAACSSDEISEMQGPDPVVPPVTEEYASTGEYDFGNGVTMAVGALDENEGAVTRATSTDGSVEFCINLSKVDNILRDFDDYKLAADDFAIRVDGVYQDIPAATDNKVNALSIQLVEEDLKVALKDLQNLDFTDADNYTFETYLWIENKKLLNDGSGTYGELFTDAKKGEWIGGKTWPVDEGEETGVDLSQKIWLSNGSDGANFFNEGAEQLGLLVKYNVYRGLQGYNGDTPYIKVSISVEKPEHNTVGPAENQATWIYIPYVAK